MENEKGEACPPLQLKDGEQRHRGAWSSIWGAQRLRKCPDGVGGTDGETYRAVPWPLPHKENTGPQRGRRLLRATQQFGG